MKYAFQTAILLLSAFLSAKTEIMDIYMGTERVGWYEMREERKDSFIEVTENSKMSLTVYGNTMNVSAHSFSLYDGKWNMIKFLTGVESEQLSFFANGFIKDGKLTVKSDIAQGYSEDVYDIKDKILLFNVESASFEFVGKEIYQYNPLTRKLDKVKVSKEGGETLTISGKKYASDVYKFSSSGGEWRVYFDKEGDVLKSLSSEGIAMVRTDSVREVSSPIDILNWFFISAEGNFKGIDKAEKAAFLIERSGTDSLSNYRQRQKGDTIEVVKNPYFVPSKLSSMDEYYINSGDLVKRAAKELKEKKSKDKVSLMKELVKYVNKKLKKGIYSGLLTSEDILRQGYGDCTEHAQVFASIARELGFDADVVSGIVYSKDGFYYHAWNRILLDGKIYTLDATFNQFEADVSHIQLSEGFPPMKVLLTDLTGKISIRRIK